MIEPEAIINTARESSQRLWWMLSTPLFWLLLPLSVWHSIRYRNHMTKKDVEEWAKKSFKE